MSHFRLEEWADFSRDLATQELTEKMRDHLLRDCETCRESSAFIDEVADFLPMESSQQVPDGDVRLAKALAFGARRIGQPAGGAMEVLAELVFDSRTQPVPAGIRATAIRGRHLVFVSGDYRVEVRIEEDDATGKSSILGQIFRDEYGAADVAVVFSSAYQGVCGSALTNAVGEFEFESGGSDLEMRVLPYGGDPPMVVALAEINNGGEIRPGSRP